MKCNQSRPGFELVSPCPFPTTITITPQAPTDWLYMSRRDGGWGRTSFEDSVNASIWGLKDYIIKSKERLITVIRNSKDNIKVNRSTIMRKQKWEEKQLYGYFKRQTDKFSYEKTWTWLRKRNFKRETKFLLLYNCGRIFLYIIIFFILSFFILYILSFGLVPADHRVKIKENKNRDKDLDFAREIKKLWNINVMVIPIVIGVLGTVLKGLLKGWKSWKLEEELSPSKLQHCWGWSE